MIPTCQICNESDCMKSSCALAIEETIKRVEKQNKQYNIATNSKKCNGCDNRVVYPRQLCDTCKEERRVNRVQRDIEKRKKERFCLTCGKVLPDKISNSAKYCQDNDSECIPSRKKQIRPSVKGKAVTRGKNKKAIKINPYYLRRKPEGGEIEGGSRGCPIYYEA